MRTELWAWLEAVVDWVNTEHVWDPSYLIPPCWPRHPHVVHEIAVLADQRYKAGHAIASDTLEAGHRHALPGVMLEVAGSCWSPVAGVRHGRFLGT